MYTSVESFPGCWNMRQNVYCQSHLIKEIPKQEFAFNKTSLLFHNLIVPLIIYVVLHQLKIHDV